jgi:hypothetical protein
MEYYLYVSKTKVNMLYEQIVSNTPKTVETKASLGIPKIGSIERSTQSKSSDSIYTRLDMVKHYLFNANEICLLEDIACHPEKKYTTYTGQWKSTLIAKSYDEKYLLGKEKDPSTYPRPRTYVTFCSSREALVFLAGSASNMLGYNGKVDEYYSVISESCTMDEFIMNLSPNVPPDSNRILPGTFSLFAHLWNTPTKNLKVLFVIYHRYEVTIPIWESCKEEFDHYEAELPDKPNYVLLGSPIFVALC